MYLVDTNVISTSAPARPREGPDVAAWMERNAAHLYLSVVTVAEVVDGIAKARREGATRRADAIAGWLELLVRLYADRILPMDVHVARRTGELSDNVRGQGHDPGFADLIIGATADHHRLTVLTRNMRHFKPMGIASHNPFDTLPGER